MDVIALDLHMRWLSAKRKDGELRFMRKMTMLEFVSSLDLPYYPTINCKKQAKDKSTCTPVLMKVIKGNFRLPSFKYWLNEGKGSKRGQNSLTPIKVVFLSLQDRWFLKASHLF